MAKAKGYFEKFLVMDCETSGLAINSDDPSYNSETGEEFQSVSWGMIVVGTDKLNVIEDLYVEIKWNGSAEWNMKAQAVHGLTKEHLAENGLEEHEAVEAIGNLLIKHWPGTSIRTAGHNVATFDLWFLKRLMRRQGIELPFGNRHIDTSTVGFVNYNAFTSDELFTLIGFDERGSHNALDDAYMSLGAIQQTRQLFDYIMNGGE